MAYRTEKNGQDTDIVIDGWEKGIADSPELGLASIQSGNISSIPGEISTSFSTQSSTLPPVGVTGASFSAIGATDVVTVSSTASYYPGMAIKLDTSSVTTAVRALLVGAGGGGGGTNGASVSYGGGGGGGAVQDNASIPIAIGSFPVVVGVLGTGAGTTTSQGTNGNPSTFHGFSASGGGGGGGGNVGVNNTPGLSGASGGGGGGANNNTSGAGGAATAGNVGASGSGGSPNANNGGGGGGAGTAGSSGVGTNGGNGGNGVANSISGSSVTYGGGGGGRGSSGDGTGGTGGGGTGGSAGTTNTGGGGGGSANGGSGIVIIAYPTGTITATGGSITTSGGNTIHTFTAGTTNFVVTAVNPQPENVYYVGNISGNTFKLYNDIGLTSVANFLTDLTGTYDVPSFGIPVWSSYYQYYASTTSPAFPFTFILDNPGNCWYLRETAVTAAGGTIAANSLQYTGNTGHAASGTNADFGIVVWRNYLFVIVGRTMDYISIPNLIAAAGPNGAWVYAWKTDLTYTNYQHQSLAATDDAIYICNANSIASLLQNAGQAFDPTNTATYTWNISALLLPSYDEAMSIAQLGTTLLIGGILNYIYPWDRVSTSFNYPLVCADKGMYRIVSTNSNAYVFAGTRGRIYICNAVQIQLYQEVPDAFSGDPEPYYNWQDAIYLRNKLYFTFTGTTNAGVALTNVGGIWALGIDSGQTQVDVPTAGSLYNINQFSYGTYGGGCPVILQSMLANPPGYGIGGAWTNSSVTGVDVSSSVPYTNFQTVIQTDIMPIGTYYTSATNRQIEYKLSRPLVAGESVRISWRGNLTSAFTPVWTSTTTGQVSDAKQVNFQKQQWAQLQIELSSTASTPSYVRLREVRIR